jgi:hypothetical protein
MCNVRARVAPAEQRLEEIAVPIGATGRIAAAAKLETGVPVRRWAKVLPRPPLRAELIVGRALLGVLEHFVGLAQCLELRLGIRLLTHVRVILPGKLAVRSLNLVLRGIARDAHGLVVILILHQERVAVKIIAPCSSSA